MNDSRVGLIAVVDDDPSILQSLACLLESADYRVRLFASGALLLDSDCVWEIDCLVTDIDMPGLDGLELVRRITETRPNLPTILITGYPDRLKQLLLPAGGCQRLFTKPFPGDALLEGVADALRGKRT